jgi:16S rRNA processing protein RimM
MTGAEQAGMTVEHDSRRVLMGRVGGLYGVRGWVKVHSFTSPPENILRYSPWWVRIGTEWKTLAVAGGRAHGKGIVAQLAGYADRDLARALVGADIAVERAQMAAPASDEYYWTDLIGAAVANRDGVEFGRVDHLLETGANDVLVVQGERGETLIPFVAGRYVLEVDLDRKRILVDWEAGD